MNGIIAHDVNKRTEKLEKILAIEIERAAELLKENAVLLKELEQVKKQRDSLRRCYDRLQRERKIPCDRSKAMIEYGDVDISEVIGSK